ncbi:MAG: quinone oxidoreductase [Acidobacteria bacterium]|nr:quinone oxidoreductase [Acidobacteriota bacterium]
MKKVVIRELGGPEVLAVEEAELPVCPAGGLLVRVEACGVNFIDIYHRTGLYRNPLPYGMGLEGAGTIVEVGEGIDGFGAGDRVAWVRVSGSYAEYNVIPAEQAVKLPAGVETTTAAAVMLQGTTAHYLARSTYKLRQGDTCLIHAAAGGVGLLLCQVAHMAGARVIGTASTPEKARLAREAGAGEVILYREQDFESELKRLTGGRGVQVVYDSVGRDTYEKSLNCLAPRGMLVLYGQSSGVVPPIDPTVLSAKGSLFLTRPSLFHYMSTREEFAGRAGDVLEWVASGALKVRIGATFPLAEAAQAHRALEARQTSGKVLLIP